jgi:hypothetical protein
MSTASPMNPTLKKIQFPALLAGVAGLAICIVTLMRSSTPEARTQFFVSYLFAYMFWIGIPLGCFSILMLQHLTGGAWGLVMRRLLEGGTRMLPLMALFFIPLTFGMGDLYAWMHDQNLHGFKADWLTKDGFINRAIVYFAIWIVIAFFLNKWSKDQDRGDRPNSTRKLQFISGPGLLIYGMTITGAAVDWVMTLDHHWYSTIYGMLFIVGQGLGTLAMMIVLVALLSQTRPLSEVVTTNHFNDLGNLLLAFVLLWAYVSFSQYLIIWSGNIAEETPYYATRTLTNWKYIALVLIILHFFVPFLLLVSRKTKRSIPMLVSVAVWIVLMRFVDLFWMIQPSVAIEGHGHQPGQLGHFHVHWLDIVAPIGIGGVWIAVYIWQIQRRPLVPPHDPRLLEVQHHHG